VCDAYNGRISKKKNRKFPKFSKKNFIQFFFKQLLASYYELFTAIRRYSSALPVRFPCVKCPVYLHKKNVFTPPLIAVYFTSPKQSHHPETVHKLLYISNIMFFQLLTLNIALATGNQLRKLANHNLTLAKTFYKFLQKIHQIWLYFWQKMLLSATIICINGDHVVFKSIARATCQSNRRVDSWKTKSEVPDGMSNGVQNVVENNWNGTTWRWSSPGWFLGCLLAGFTNAGSTLRWNRRTVSGCVGWSVKHSPLNSCGHRLLTVSSTVKRIKPLEAICAVEIVL